MKYYKWIRYLISDRAHLKRARKVISPNLKEWGVDLKAVKDLEDNIHSVTLKNNMNQLFKIRV